MDVILSPQEKRFNSIKGGRWLPSTSSATSEGVDQRRLIPLVHFANYKDRIIHMAKDPLGTCVATGSGDKTIKFWDVFRSSSRDDEDDMTRDKNHLLREKSPNIKKTANHLAFDV